MVWQRRMPCRAASGPIISRLSAMTAARRNGERSISTFPDSILEKSRIRSDGLAEEDALPRGQRTDHLQALRDDGREAERRALDLHLPGLHLGEVEDPI